jgi:hypothetical protein
LRPQTPAFFFFTLIQEILRRFVLQEAERQGQEDAGTNEIVTDELIGPQNS